MIRTVELLAIWRARVNLSLAQTFSVWCTVLRTVFR